MLLWQYRFYYVDTTSIRFSLRCYSVPTTSYEGYVNFEHVQSPSVPFLQTPLRSYIASTTLIPFQSRSFRSNYALALFEERSKDGVETWPGVTGGINGTT